jgi:hypothetical protein
MEAPSLYTMMSEARATGRHLEVVAGSAPGWQSPWARARVCSVHPDFHGFGHRLLDEHSRDIELATVQLARFAERDSLTEETASQ